MHYRFSTSMHERIPDSAYYAMPYKFTVNRNNLALSDSNSRNPVGVVRCRQINPPLYGFLSAAAAVERFAVRFANLQKYLTFTVSLSNVLSFD